MEVFILLFDDFRSVVSNGTVVLCKTVEEDGPGSTIEVNRHALCLSTKNKDSPEKNIHWFFISVDYCQYRAFKRVCVLPKCH